MNTKITPAVERAVETVLRKPKIDGTQGIVVTVLDSALDVEKMAQAMAERDSIPWSNMRKYQKDDYRALARAVRTSILGVES